MVNKYDTEFVRRQLYDIHFKLNGSSYEESSGALNMMIKELNEQSIAIDKFKEEYKKNHKMCPKCNTLQHSTTLVAYVLDMDKKEEYKNLNKCVCTNCGNIHTTHDRVAELQ